MKITAVSLLVLATILFSAPPASAQQCLDWQRGLAGPDGPVFAADAAVYDAGTGPKLFTVGLHRFGCVIPTDMLRGRIATWDGVTWEIVAEAGPPSCDRRIQRAVVFDDGTGPALFVAGNFLDIGGIPASMIARYDGTTWSPLGTGLSATVRDLQVLDLGGGPALYAAGDFLQAGGQPAARVASWNGTSWTPVGALGLNAPVNGIAAFDDGSGIALYACGSMTGVGYRGLVRWNGTAWGAATPSTFNSDVADIGVFDAGTGPELYVTHPQLRINGNVMNRIARTAHGIWSQVAGGFSGTVNLPSRLETVTYGGTTALYVLGYVYGAGGMPVDGLARWDGTSWSTLGNGIDDDSSGGALVPYDDPEGSALYFVGDHFSGNIPGAYGVARWNGSSWRALGNGFTAPVNAFATFDTGAGPELYAGGDFTFASNVNPLNRVARWTGAGWQPLGTGVTDRVLALTTWDDGGGADLYAGGEFTVAGGIWADGVARWDGSAWSALGNGSSTFGIVGYVHALLGHDDGAGSKLYAGGNFLTSAGNPSNYIARWNGVAWSAVTSGMNSLVYALAEYDEGAGPHLFAGGQFTTAGGVSAPYLARWDGTAWSDVGGGLNGTVASLAVFDDGTGPALYAGGAFTVAGATPSFNVARWNGTSWDTLAGGADGIVFALSTFDDGSGTALYATGTFLTIGGVPAQRIARWNGTSWTALDGGLSDTGFALLAFDDGQGPARLAVGGSFTYADGSSSGRFALWNGCFDDVTSFCAGDGVDPFVTTPCPCGNTGAPGHGCANSPSSAGALLESSGAPNPDTLVLSASLMPSTSTCIYLQGDQLALGGLAFGDGLRCADGTLIRMKIRTNNAGASIYPEPGEVSISVRGSVAPGSGDVRGYQVYYRSAAAAFCPPATFNVTNGVRVVW